MCADPNAGKASVPPPRELGAREAFGGPWALSLVGTALLTIPTLLLAILLESATRYPHWSLVLLSAAVQQLAQLVLQLVAIVVLRARERMLPLWGIFALWGAFGAIRGVFGGLLATVLAGAPPDYAFRIVFWVAIAAIWQPLFVWAAGQFSHRRLLLGRLAESVSLRESARLLGERSGQEIREELISTIRGSLGPVVQEVRLSLRAVSSSIDAQRMRLIGERLAVLSSQSSRFVERLEEAPPQPAMTEPRRSTPVLAALNFERHRPFVSAAYSGAALVALILPASLYAEPDERLAVDIVVCVLVSVVVMTVAARLMPVTKGSRGELALAWARYVLAGLVGSLLLVALRVDQMSPYVGVLVVVLPLGIVISSSIIGAAVGLPEANRLVIDSIWMVDQQRRAYQEATLEEENRVRAQLSELMHGPIQGRLAACAMALNFHAADMTTAPSERTEEITTQVLLHLEAASHDLDALAEAA